jgi:hypothetical protein
VPAGQERAVTAAFRAPLAICEMVGLHDHTLTYFVLLAVVV